jgi:hypothetical protein
LSLSPFFGPWRYLLASLIKGEKRQRGEKNGWEKAEQFQKWQTFGETLYDWFKKNFGDFIKK